MSVFPARSREAAKLAIPLLLTALFALSNVDAAEPADPAGGRVYAVGPRQELPSLSAVPWNELEPGDVVRIHWRPEPYREKIVIGRSGTAKRPIRIVGVRGPNGQRPIIDGRDAMTIAGQSEAYGSHEPMQATALLLIYHPDFRQKPAHIEIRGLHLRNARRSFSFTDRRGRRTRYARGAAAIRIQAADDVRIIDNEIENCANGIFSMCQEYNEAALTRDLLIEGNDIHRNGERGSYLEHGVYLQAIGVTCQFNRFGPNLPGAEGATLKDRSAGTVIRFNWFESGGTRILDLVEVEDCAPWFLESAYRDYLRRPSLEDGPGPDRLDEVRAIESRYRKTYVYGNLIRHLGSRSPASNLIHYGYDNDPAYARQGDLYFYHNTLLVLNDRNDSWRVRLFDIYPYDETAGRPARERVHVLNNIIYVASETPGAEASYFCWGSGSGEILLGTNAVGGEWRTEVARSECYSGRLKPVVRGQRNILTLLHPPIDRNTLAPHRKEAISGRATPLPRHLIRSHPPCYEYQRDLQRKERPHTRDLGALTFR